jgi:hypothetical protein
VLVLVGAQQLLASTGRIEAAGGAFLLAAGGAVALGVLYWETTKTLLVSQLDRAWHEVSADAPDRAAARE